MRKKGGEGAPCWHSSGRSAHTMSIRLASMSIRLASMSTRLAPPRALACAARRHHLSSRRTIEVISPRDGAPFATLHDWTASDVAAAVESGGRHLVSEWVGRSDLAIERRCNVLRRIGAALRTRAEELAQLESRDCGKPITESRVDLETCAALFDYYAEIAPEMLTDQPLTLPDEAEAFRARIVPHPVGLVGAVTPWNYPLMQAVGRSSSRRLNNETPRFEH